MYRLPFATILILAGWHPSLVYAQGCDVEKFKQTVAVSSAAISQANATNGKALQDKLQKWRSATGLTETEFAAKAGPLIKDDKTAEIDTDNRLLLGKVQSLGGGAPADPGRCEAMVAELRILMEKIAANTEARWSHMLGRVNAASAGPIQAGASQ